ncbi:MAG: TetR/AcrR family transcriptional regulator [Moraxellaceae bacterium]|nr:MAG: TetR/AcrR family transcriptional regulator [Moraxellaceae bacterium]
MSPAMAKRVYAKKNPQDRVIERRDRLLQAALQLFATKGYANTTIEALCSEAKVTTRHFYQVFAGREALLLALYDQLMAELQAGLLNALLAEHSSLQQKINQVIQALVKQYLTDTRRAQVGVLEVVGASPAVEKRRREVIHVMAMQLQVFLDGLAAQQKIPSRNYHWLTVAIVGGVNELMAEWLMNPLLTLEELSNEIVSAASMLLQGIDGTNTGFNQ